MFGKLGEVGRSKGSWDILGELLFLQAFRAFLDEGSGILGEISGGTFWRFISSFKVFLGND